MPDSFIGDLQRLRSRIQHDHASEATPCLVICAGTACQASGANRIQREIKREIIKRDLVERLNLRITGCHGFCEMGPSILTEPQGAFYVKVEPHDVSRVIDAVLLNDYVEDLLYKDPVSGLPCLHQNEISFFSEQTRTILGRNQLIDPIRIYHYIREGGYSALETVLASKDRGWITEEVKKSGLRGRGGAGFSTGLKWEIAAAQPGEGGKYVVCNADEGDPGAYMDSGILEGNPHSVIEGMMIGGLAIGATEGFVFVRKEYPLAIKHTLIALRHAEELNLLGKNILGTGIDFNISIVQSAGAFVCGEETALVRTIEGFVGEPRQRPPYPVERGIFGKPTVINNVETWANVPLVITAGAEKYAEIGTESNTGTKVFSVVGKIRHTGLMEVPMGTSINTLINDIGGGPLEGRRIKAIQIGGPSGGCIPSDHFDLPIDYDSLTGAGAIMGSGGVIVLDDDSCMVDLAKYFMAFLKDESCGKCFTCRKGIQRMHEILDDITNGRGTIDKLGLLEELAGVVRDSTMCGLGQSAPNPVLSTLRYFKDEYLRHIVDKRCDSFVCKGLVGAPCQSGCPIGTEAWRYIAHIERGELDEAYLAIRETNPFPSVCARVCDHKCESRCKLGTSGANPVAIRALKRFVTDRVDPTVYQPRSERRGNGHSKKVAIVGSGPAGLTAAHRLSLMGHKVSVFEALDRPGGMLVAGVPTFRMPRDVLTKEIDALIDDSVTLTCNSALGKDFTLDDLFQQGHEAVFLALGAHRSKKLGLDGEDCEGTYPSLNLLKAWNLHGEKMARGRVGVIGGGNSAIDAARVAIRQEDVDSVTIFYRRTRHEMPAFETEIEEALEEGISLQVLVSPAKIHTEGDRICAVDFIKNQLGEPDNSGRRRPVPVEGSEESVPLDTLVVAIGEEMEPFVDGDTEIKDGVQMTRWGSIVIDPDTMMTSRTSVFAGGDAVTGPNTVVDAIAAGHKVAVLIDRHLRRQPLVQPAEPTMPSRYVPKSAKRKRKGKPVLRVEQPRVAPDTRCKSDVEVEKSITKKAAVKEAGRCLRCDLDFSKPKAVKKDRPSAGEIR